MMRDSHLTERAPVTPGTTSRSGKPWSVERVLHVHVQECAIYSACVLDTLMHYRASHKIRLKLPDRKLVLLEILYAVEHPLHGSALKAVWKCQHKQKIIEADYAHH